MRCPAGASISASERAGARAEFFALGRQHLYERRGAYTDEALDVMQACWSAEGDVAFNGEFHRFRKVRFQPRPVQQPRIPLWIGSRGTAPAPLRRAAKYADFWHPTGLSPEEVKRGSEVIDEQAGRSVPTSIRGRVASDASLGEMQDLARRLPGGGLRGGRRGQQVGHL